MTRRPIPPKSAAPTITDQHDLPNREAPMAQPNRHVIGTAEKNRQPAEKPNVHDEERVENRHAQNQDRRQERHRVTFRVLTDHRQRPSINPMNIAPGISHIDGRRPPVVAEKSQEASHESRQHEGDRLISIQDRHDTQEDRTDDADTCRQAVHNIQEIERVDDADHPKNRQCHVDPIRKREQSRFRSRS